MVSSVVVQGLRGIGGDLILRGARGVFGILGDVQEWIEMVS